MRTERYHAQPKSVRALTMAMRSDKPAPGYRTIPLAGALCICTALLGRPGVAAGQEIPVGWMRDVWTTSDGLPVNGLTDVVQTRDGYLWIATWDGLVRFDGVRFMLYNRSNMPGLPGNRLADLFETRDGTLWVRTEHNQLAAIVGGVARTVGVEDGLPGSEAGPLFADRDSTLLVGTDSGLFAWKEGRFEAIWKPDDRLEGAATYSAVLRARDGTLWIGTYSRGLIRIRDQGVTRITTVGSRELSTIVWIREDADGRILLNTTPWQANRAEQRAQGIFEVHGDSLVAADLAMPASSGDLPPGMRMLLRRSGETIADRRGLLVSWTDRAEGWVPTVLERRQVSVRGEVLYLGWDQLYRSDGFALRFPSHPYGVIEDREGSIWVATNGEGLWRYREVPFRTIGKPEGLREQNVYPVLVDRSGRLWTAEIGENGLMMTDRPGERPATWLLPGVGVLTLYEDRDGQIWVGTNIGLCVYPPAEGGPPTVCTPVSLPGNRRDPVYAIHQDRQGGLWVASSGALYRRSGTGWTDFPEAIATAPTVQSSFSGSRPSRRIPVRRIRQELPVARRIRVIAEDRDGTLWFGSAAAGVMAHVDEPGTGVKGGRFIHITTRNGLPSNAIRDIVADESGYVWIVTEDAGLARLDPREGAESAELSVVGTRDGLPEDALHSLRADAFGRFWMASNRGLFWVDRKELNAFLDGDAPTFRSAMYTERDGLRNKEFNGGYSPSSAVAPDGTLWFPGQAGVVRVDAARLASTAPPPVVVESVSLGGETRSAVQAIVLDAVDRTFDIQYTALSYLVSESIRFRYRLEGYDEGWTDAGTRRTAYYTGVPAGSYVFLVQAAGKDGVWNEQGATLEVTVRPFFRETAWFYVLLVLAVLGLGTAGVQFRVRQLRARQLELEAVVERRTREIEAEKRRTEDALGTVEAQAERLRTLDAAKSRFFANISHEFRTPLTLILGPLEQVLMRSDLAGDARTSLELLQRNARRLSHLINQLLDLARIDAGGLALHERRHDFDQFARQCLSLFESLARVRGVRLTYSGAEEPLSLVYDAEHIEKVVLNLLSNALKFTPAGGEVTVSVGRHQNGSVFLSVEDTGIGIPADRMDHVFDRFYQVDDSSTRRREGSGIGLALARELVTLHGGELNVRSSPGIGTTFTMTLPDRPGSAGSENVDEDGEWGPGDSTGMAARLQEVVSTGGAEEPDTTSGRAEVDSAGAPETRSMVLLVEDNVDLRQYVRSLLEPDFNVVEASDGDSGLQDAIARIPDLVLSDVMMGGKDGFTLCRDLKTDVRTSHIPVVLLTARADEGSRISGLETGADDYVAKPFHPDELRVRLRNLIEQRRMLRARFSQSVLVLGAEEVVLPSREIGFLENVKSIVQTHLQDPDFDVDRLVMEIGMSRRQFERKLGALVGESPGSLIRRMRLERAAQLLRVGDMPVKEAAWAVGYRSVPHFSEAFAQIYGVSPSGFAGQDRVN